MTLHFWSDKVTFWIHSVKGHSVTTVTHDVASMLSMQLHMSQKYQGLVLSIVIATESSSVKQLNNIHMTEHTLVKYMYFHQIRFECPPAVDPWNGVYLLLAKLHFLATV